ncbi:MAG: methyl-accepting chemotaxis protein [Anaeromyxobacteraceae bacterium]
MTALRTLRTQLITTFAVLALLVGGLALAGAPPFVLALSALVAGGVAVAISMRFLSGAVAEAATTSARRDAEAKQLAEQGDWYRGIVDAVPFPIHVTDADMKWTFMNTAFEKLMIQEKRVVNRAKAVGMDCSNANANICNTDGCGIRQHRKGVKESYFDWCGMKCKQDTAELKDKAGKVIGYVETVTDLTAITKLKDEAADRAAWYEAILDAVPFPIHVTDDDMKWTFMNRSFEKLMIQEKRVVDRRQAVGMACSNASANICNTDKCGIAQLKQGKAESYFDWCGMHCKQDTAPLLDRNGKRVGFVETVTDLTALIRTRNYSQVEVERLAANLAKLAKGDLAVDLEVGKADQHTEQAAQDFRKIGAQLTQVTHAVQALVGDAKMLAGAAVEGRLATRAEAAKHQGAYRDVVDGVNRTLDTVIAPVKEATGVLERIAKRDLRARVTGDFQGDHSSLKEAVNSSANALNEALAQVAIAVEQVNGAATQIAASSQAVAAGASEQAASLQQTTASVETVSSMTQRSAENAQQAAVLATSARHAATEGAEAVKQLDEAMVKIKASAEGTSQIIKDVSDIAFQTNLLALNAAVEAARAGDAGRGFAVVAEEVRSLAQRAKEAAQKTEDLIRQSVKQAGEGEAAAVQVAGQLRQIQTGIGKVTDIVQEIAGAAKEQTQGIDQVNSAVTQMDKVTQQNAASAEESSSAASELSGQAEELASMVATFQLERQQGGGFVPAGLPAARRRLPSHMS